jgi:hypothetical protein
LKLTAKREKKWSIYSLTFTYLHIGPHFFSFLFLSLYFSFYLILTLTSYILFYCIQLQYLESFLFNLFGTLFILLRL